MSALRHPDPLEQELADLRAEVARLGGQLAELLAAGGQAPDWRTPKMIETDFRISHSTVARWVAADTVRVKRIGGRILIDAKTVPRQKYQK